MCLIVRLLKTGKQFLAILSILTLVGSPVSAQIQTSWVPYDFFNNVGGLNDGFGSTAIADGEASDLQNVVFTTGGFVERRQGSD